LVMGCFAGRFARLGSAQPIINSGKQSTASVVIAIHHHIEGALLRHSFRRLNAKKPVTQAVFRSWCSPKLAISIR
jgi:hypothetical protein